MLTTQGRPPIKSISYDSTYDGPSDDPYADQSPHARAIEFLAADTHTPVNQITEIYEREFAKLVLNASIQTYLPVLTMRKVREVLRLQNTDITSVAQRSNNPTSLPLLQWCPARNRMFFLLPRARPAAILATS